MPPGFIVRFWGIIPGRLGWMGKLFICSDLRGVCGRVRVDRKSSARAELGGVSYRLGVDFCGLPPFCGGADRCEKWVATRQ